MQRLHPQYIVGFVDGEGCFCVSIAKHKTLKRKVEVRAEFEIELRADDGPILKRLQYTLGCGKLYKLNYERYGWQPHLKFKVSNVKELSEIIIPFFDKHRLQAKKGYVYSIFRKIVLMMKDKSHLTEKGFTEIVSLREKMRAYSKKHYRNR
jgi:hypothetical protein